LVVVYFCSRHKEFDEPMDGVVYGAVASLGFATLENILYVSTGGLGLAVVRALSAVPGHAFMGAIMGSYVARAKFGPAEERTGNLARAYFIPMLLHAVYDGPLLTLKHFGQHPPVAVALMGFISVGVLIFEWWWTVSLVKRLHADQVSIAARTVTAAVITPEVVAVAEISTATVTPAPPPPASKWTAGAILAVVFGSILSSIGGLFTLGIIIGLATKAPKDLAAVLMGGLLIGVLPLALGILLFRVGLRRAHGP
jgi:hypothetical protein